MRSSYKIFFLLRTFKNTFKTKRVSAQLASGNNWKFEDKYQLYFTLILNVTYYFKLAKRKNLLKLFDFFGGKMANTGRGILLLNTVKI